VSTVFIPAVLRPNVGGVKSLELEGDSIRRSSGRSSSSHPSLEGQLLTTTASSTASSTSTSTARTSATSDGLDTPVAPADEVRSCPAMAGG
jgi:molybdopterin converting factor small subunit